MSSRRTLLFPALLAAALPAFAQEAPAGHPADSAEPMTAIAPAAGIPAYDDDATTEASDKAPENDTQPAPRPQARMQPYKFGLTLVTPLAGIVEQRIPVSLNKGGSGRMRAWSYGGEASFRHISEDLVAYGSLDYRRMDFAFEDTSVKGVPGAPWGDTDQYRFNAHAEGKMDERWWWFVNGGLRLGAEREASLGDSFTIRGTLGAKAALDNGLSLYVGAGALSRMDRSALFIPMVGLDWRAGKWGVRTINGIAVTYDAFGNNDLIFDFSSVYDTTQFRLREEPGTGRPRDVEFQEVTASAGVTKNFGRYSFVRAYVACIAWSDYRFHTDGSTTGDFEASPGAIFGFSAGARF